MNTKMGPEELCIDLLERSPCSVKVAAVIQDFYGIMSWSWNHVGFDGLGEHAEMGAIRRANRKRLLGSTLYVAAKRARNDKVVTARPCEACQRNLGWFSKVFYRDADGEWERFK